jgi:4-diphosphocytidyl-2-C-methyl-D-erythritol kinase
MGWPLLTLKAFAKINLVLEVLGKRSDGYHDIASIMQTVDMFDILTFEPAEEIKLTCTIQGLRADTNMVLKAGKALKKATDYKGGAVIGLEKHIPRGAGLGGGSSDAAVTLTALNRLWGLGLAAEDLCSIGAGLGSDVPFFIYGGTFLAEGRGEKLTRLPDLEQAWFILLRPDIPAQPAKTARLYAMLRPEHFTTGEPVSNARQLLLKERSIRPGLLYNVFEKVAFEAFPGLDKYRDKFKSAGADEIHLAGSGPVLFTMRSEKSEAMAIQEKLVAQGADSCVISSVKSQQIEY